MAAARPFIVLVLVVAGLLVILFVLGVGRTFELRKPDLHSLSSGFGARRLQLADLVRESDRACVVGSSSLQIPAQVTCSLMARASDEPIWRRRVVSLRTDGQVKVIVTSSGEGPSVEGKPGSGEDAELPIAREGARIDLACGRVGTQPCQVTWRR